MAPRRYNLGKRATVVEETRRRILDAIVGLHAEKGVLGTSFDDIARRADVALGTVQRHFPSLDDIVRACGPRIVEITRPPNPPISSGQYSLSQQIKTLVQELFGFYERVAPWLEVGRCERKKLPVLDAGVRHLEERLEATVRESLRPSVIDQRTLKIVTALTDFYVWKSLSDRGLREEAADLISDILLYWLRGTVVEDKDRTSSPSPTSTITPGRTL
ncbi:MAG: hypothetical protein A3G40_14945 [Deltaproteobacteria bacterium RIFCSPLOWO2_12_FULL_57_22]|nr:MAG: hypothetical protein A3G40_14945 [Deltaproteobacteria bacterium RIFCSPLOWO2_12_FULL_57_22]